MSINEGGNRLATLDETSQRSVEKFYEIRKNDKTLERSRQFPGTLKAETFSPPLSLYFFLYFPGYNGDTRFTTKESRREMANLRRVLSLNETHSRSNFTDRVKRYSLEYRQFSCNTRQPVCWFVSSNWPPRSTYSRGFRKCSWILHAATVLVRIATYENTYGNTDEKNVRRNGRRYSVLAYDAKWHRF